MNDDPKHLPAGSADDDHDDADFTSSSPWGYWFRDRIAERGWTYEEAISAIGAEPTRVYQWQKGQRPGHRYAKQIADALGVRREVVQAAIDARTMGELPTAAPPNTGDRTGAVARTQVPRSTSVWEERPMSAYEAGDSVKTGEAAILEALLISLKVDPATVSDPAATIIRTWVEQDIMQTPTQAAAYLGYVLEQNVRRPRPSPADPQRRIEPDDQSGDAKSA